MTALAQSDVGADQWGRVVYYSYFRPPGLPGQVTPTPPGTTPSSFTTPVIFPWTSGEAYPSTIISNYTPPPPAPPAVAPPANSLLSTNNPLHGFESYRFPNLNYPAPPLPPAHPTFSPQWVGGAPIDLPLGTPPPPQLPTR